MWDAVSPGKRLLFQSKEHLRRVHDELTVEFSRRVPAGLAAFRFPRPPIAGVANFIFPIRNAADLTEEGRLQSNCVATYAKRVESGEAFIYRVLYPERATLSVVRAEGRTWARGELKAAGNSPVSAATEKFVSNWLTENEFPR
jgi:hypothetical protein